MNQPEKVEVVDFIINMLKDHEQTLDNLADRVEAALSNANPENPQLLKTIPVKIIVNEWSEFKEKSRYPEFVGFNLTNSIFQVTALKDSGLFIYREQVPEVSFNVESDNNELIVSGFNLQTENLCILNGKLESGLELIPKQCLKDANNGIKFAINDAKTRDWLSNELQINRDFIVNGVIET